MVSVLGATEAFVAVTFPSAQVGYVSDWEGRVYRTDDGGRTWTTAFHIAARWPLQCLDFPTPVVGFVGSRDCLFRTDDSGISWESLSSTEPNNPIEQRLRARRGSMSATDGPGEVGIMVDLQQATFKTADWGYAVGGTMILETLDRGYSWEIIGNTEDYMHDVCCIDKMVHAVGNDATIINVDTSSRSTRTISLDSRAALLSLCFSSRNDGVAVGEGGTIVRTQDGGDTWHPIESGSDSFLQCVAFFDQQRGLAGGLRGILLTTDDGGSTWSVAELPRDLSLYDIAIVSESTAYIACSGGIILKTTDAGKTFHFVPFRVA